MTYSGSNTIANVAWYSSNSNNKTHEVGKKLPNELGLYDMTGNVWERCWDLYSSHTRYNSFAGSTNPVWSTTISGNNITVNRGGCYNSSVLVYLYSATRIRDYNNSYRNRSFGFRVARRP